MKKNIILINFVLVLILINSGCKKEKVNLKSESQKLLNTDKQFALYSKANGTAEAFRKFLMEEALQFSAGGNIIFGSESIYNIMKQEEGAYDLLWEPQFAEVAESGDLGWTWGYYDLHIKQTSDTRYGKYLNVWKRNEQGEWKVAADIGNSGPSKEERKAK